MREITAGHYTDTNGKIQHMLYALGNNGKVYKYLHASGWVLMKPTPKPKPEVVDFYEDDDMWGDS